MKQQIIKAIAHRVPSLDSYLRYRYALTRLLASEVGSSETERDYYFDELVRRTRGHSGLQVSAKKKVGRIDDNWIIMDKFAEDDLLDCRCDLLRLPFRDGSFSGIFCQSVLEHVVDPVRAVDEMFRVLRPGGGILVQLPFNLNYHADPDDYWRASPMGLRLWMSRFKEIRCGTYSWTGSPLNVTSYFFGRRPTEA